MAIKTVLFDLDGTLLPMDEKKFIKGYFGMLCKKLEPFGYQAQSVVDGIWYGTNAMYKNDGSKINEQVFWENFAQAMGEDVLDKKELFDEFYHTEFKLAKEFCGYNPKSREIIDMVKELGYRVVCATNPIFPSIATETRMEFAGLSKNDFEYFTCYENSSYCKPNPKYYQEILKKLDCDPTECLMVGNDATEDMVARELGMQVFLLTDCLINKENKDISQYPHGDYDELKKYIKSL